MSLEWLKTLPLELSTIDKPLEPKGEIADKEREVGTLTEDLLRLYSLAKSMDRAADEIQLRVKYDDMPSNEETDHRVTELNAKSHALLDLFWVSVRDDLHLWGESHLGLRSNRRVVSVPPSPGDGMGGIFKHLFGGE